MVMTVFVPCASADLFVISQGTNSVLRYNEVTGEFIGVFVPSGSGGLQVPRGLLFGRDGNLYVTSSANNSVMRYDGTTGAPLPAPGQTGATFVPNGSGELRNPAQIILGLHGNLYVGSQDNDAVLRYDGTTGDFIDVFVQPGSGGLSHPAGLVFGLDGNLYVKQGGPNVVMRYDGITGAPLPAPGQTGAVFASRIGLGPGPPLVFGPDGNLYVGNFLTSEILRFNGVTGEFMDIFVSAGSGGLSGPGPLMLFGPDNNLYVCSENNNSVLRYDGTTGAFIDAFVPSGMGGLNLPHGQFFRNTDPTTLVYVAMPPSITSLVATPDVLWPPNHKMVPVSLAVAASDGTGIAPFCAITTVSSTVPGETDGVITGPLTVNLRAERLGSGNGRIYMIAVTCTNSASLSASRTVTVTVPHDQSR
jgi:streptogramin lyase